MIIYLLIVGMFQDFVVPLLMMIAIPLTLVGIIPGHLMFGAFFTATSHDRLDRAGRDHGAQQHPAGRFHQSRGCKQGLPLEEAVIEAGRRALPADRPDRRAP